MTTLSSQREKGFPHYPKTLLLFIGLLLIFGASVVSASAQPDIRIRIQTMTSCNEADSQVAYASGVNVRIGSLSVYTDGGGYATAYLRPGIYEIGASHGGTSFAYVDRRSDNVRFRPDSRGLATVPLNYNDETIVVRMLSCGVGGAAISVGGVSIPGGAIVVAPGPGGIAVGTSGAAIAVGVGPVRRARLTQVNNNVEVQIGNGMWVRAYEGQEVGPGDRVRTGYLSTISLKFWDGHHGHLRQRSQLTIRNSGAEVTHGELRVTTSQPMSVHSDFEVTTAACMVNVRGTIFTVMHDDSPQSTVVWVEEGVVLVTPMTTSLQSVTLRGGQEARVTRSYISPVVARGGVAVAVVDMPLLTGVWLTSTGDTIQLTQDGNRVWGTYRGMLGTGTINGVMDGRTFRGTVAIGQGMSSTSGNVILTLTPDGRLDGTVSSVIFNGPWVLSRGAGRIQ